MAEEVTGQEVRTNQPPHAIFQENLNPSDAVAALAKAMQEPEKPEQPRGERGRFVKPQPEAQPEAKAEEAKPEEKVEAKAEEPKKEETKDEPQPEAEIQPEPRRFKLRYKGEEKEVDENETIELAQKGYDYTQKMQDLSKQRQEAEAKVKADSEKALKQYESQLDTYRKAVTQIAGVKSMPEIETLSRTDPVAAQQEFFRLTAVNQVLATIDAEQAKITAQRQSEAQETFSKRAKEAVDKLHERIPGWSNDLYGKILKGAVDNYGFENREVNAITDHRAIEVLNDALKWREYQSAKPKTVEKRVASVPKVQKPGTAEKSNPSADRFKASVAKFNKSGDRNDAVDMMRQIIEAGG